MKHSFEQFWSFLENKCTLDVVLFSTNQIEVAI